MRQRGRNTAQLPQQLLEELGDSIQDRGRGPKKYAKANSRKEQRKVARVQKKLDHTSRHSSRVLNDGPKKAHTNRLSQPLVSIQQSKVPATSVQPKVPKSILKVPRSTLPPKQASSSLSSRSVSPQPPTRISRAAQDRLNADDAEIAALERALGVRGKKKLPKSFEDDGLDVLLGSLDDGSDLDERSLKKRKRSEEERWLERKRQKAQAKSLPHCDSEIEDASDSSNEHSELDFQVSSEDGSHLAQGESPCEIAESDLTEEDSDEQEPSTIKKPRENPFVAPGSGQPLKYVLPSRRGMDATEVENLSRLKRQLQGLLNRLSDANILSILRDIEGLYRDYPRQHISSTLIDLLMGLLADQTILSDNFVILHAGFIAAVYKTVGSDFGAQVVEGIHNDFEESKNRQSNDELIGKRLTNLVNLLANLYIFQVIGSRMIYDYIRLCLEQLSETNTELLLKIIRNAGAQLRQDDPSSLKDIVLQLRVSISKMGEENLSVRTKFMIETINNLKDNRVKAGMIDSKITLEHVTRMKKTLGSLNTRSLKATEPLRIGIEDLRNSDKVGNWWLIGASYKGVGHDTTQSSEPFKHQRINSPTTTGEKIVEITDDLARLAQEQRMNTDVRRSIFIAIMSSTDYNDAYVRVMKLRLKRKQQEEIPHVIVHCVGAENLYNPFYSLLSKRFCSDKHLKFWFQASLWNLFKRIGDGGEDPDDTGADDREGRLELRSLVNLARLFGVLVAAGDLDLGTLKHLNFPELPSQTRRFLEVLIVTAILQRQENSTSQRNEKSIHDMFLKPKEMPSIAGGLKYFLKKCIRKTDIVSSNVDKETVKWACSVACAALSTLTTKTLVDDS
ncbi:suppressor of glycerol defect [Lecanora helva]